MATSTRGDWSIWKSHKAALSIRSEYQARLAAFDELFGEKSVPPATGSEEWKKRLGYGTKITPPGTPPPVSPTGDTDNRIAAGGAKSNVVNIHIGSMVQTWNAAGGVREERADVESQFASILARVLGMAKLAN
jgi:hypothetical protein